jgi:hypothetical protein
VQDLELIRLMIQCWHSKVLGLELYSQLKRKDPEINVCFLTASSEPYREELLKEKYNQLSRDLFLEMPLPTSEIIREVKKRMQIPQ